MPRLRLGVIGVGSVVREIYQHLYFASDYSSEIEIVAIADPNARQLAWFGDTYDIPANRQHTDYQQLLAAGGLDAVHINTPDSLHEAPTVAALEAGLDVLLPKPLADSVGAAHRMRAAAIKHGRLLTVDFHKRGDPRVIEASRRYKAGQYGEFQYADWHMIDRLLVADPNHDPPFFATPDFAEKNTPISFLTVHLADSFMEVTGLRPIAVQARGWKQKLPSLKPTPVDGYDMCEVQVTFENHGLAHFVTGWHWPNHAPSISNHRCHTICTDGVFEMMHTAGYEDLTHAGVSQGNVLFQLTHPDGRVTGFGMSVPGELLRQIHRHTTGQLTDADRQAMLDPMTLGFWSTAIVEAAHQSLQQGETTDNGVTLGVPLNVADLLRDQLGDAAGDYLS